MSMRLVTWGQALRVSISEQDRGLAGVVDRIHAVVGPFIGSRATFFKIQGVEDPDELASETDRYRAWLLLVACGEDTSNWGIDDSVVPPVPGPASLRKALAPAPGLEPGTLWLMPEAVAA